MDSQQYFRRFKISEVIEELKKISNAGDALETTYKRSNNYLEPGQVFFDDQGLEVRSDSSLAKSDVDDLNARTGVTHQFTRDERAAIKKLAPNKDRRSMGVSTLDTFDTGPQRQFRQSRPTPYHVHT